MNTELISISLGLWCMAPRMFRTFFVDLYNYYVIDQCHWTTPRDERLDYYIK